MDFSTNNLDKINEMIRTVENAAKIFSTTKVASGMIGPVSEEINAVLVNGSVISENVKSRDVKAQNGDLHESKGRRASNSSAEVEWSKEFKADFLTVILWEHNFTKIEYIISIPAHDIEKLEIKKQKASKKHLWTIPLVRREKGKLIWKEEVINYFKDNNYIKYTG